MTRSTLGCMLALTACGSPDSEDPATRPADDVPAELQARQDEADAAPTFDEVDAVTVGQEEGRMVMWVMPGPRELDPAVFGTPDDPKATVDMSTVPQPAVDVVKALPILVGVPVKARKTNEDGTAFTTTAMPTPFSDSAQSVSGSFEATFRDLQAGDGEGKPTDTDDELELEISFTDPAGATYEVRNVQVVKPPLPGYETDGGVMLDGTHHGATGTGTPLMPEVYTYAAAWFLGDLVKDGEVIASHQMMHLMTTQTVRHGEYELAMSHDLPLDPDETPGGQVHHTHLVVMPVHGTPEGPDPAPLKGAFTPDGGEAQPFVHVMFEQDEVREGPPFSLPDAG